MQRNEYRLTHAELLARLRYDPRTGSFYKKNGRIAGTPHGDHRRVYVHGEFIYEHVLAWFYTHGSWPDGVVDHIDGCGSNNRLANLRVVTFSTNNLNRHAPNRNNSVGILGVHRHSTGFRAQLRVEGKVYRSEVVPTPDCAAAKYALLRRTYCPEARPNG
ncbi:hypothetical protein D3C81_545330 [compost metagenome]|jgi:hypothetical protein|uniref:HNH endonuclease signature motif containing protein n=1 Tax=Cupriavidus sp. TaxID=1873897 RepID=UPI000FA60E48|nr:HNH endonuclease signature motif containing protein [Cupriavidus sp.]